MSTTPRIAAAVLAANRYTSPVALAAAQGPSYLRTIAAQVAETSCERTAVILGNHQAHLVPTFGGVPVAVEINARATEGAASSIRAAVAWALRSGCDALLLVTCEDQVVPTAHLELLLARYRETGRLVASKLGAITGVPAVFDRQHFARLGGLAGETSAKLVIATSPQVETIAWPPVRSVGRIASRDSLAIRAA